MRIVVAIGLGFFSGFLIYAAGRSFVRRGGSMRILTLAVLLGLSLTAGSTSVLAQSRTIPPEAKPGTPATAGFYAGFYADSWAVVIGVNDYQHPRIPKLRSLSTRMRQWVHEISVGAPSWSLGSRRTGIVNVNVDPTPT